MRRKAVKVNPVRTVLIKTPWIFYLVSYRLNILDLNIFSSSSCLMVHISKLHFNWKTATQKFPPEPSVFSQNMDCYLQIIPLLCTLQSSCLEFKELGKIMLFHKNNTWPETLFLKFDVWCVKLLNKCLLNCIISKPGVVYCNVFLGVDHICISFYTSCEINIVFCSLNLANITCHFYFSLLWVI